MNEKIKYVFILIVRAALIGFLVSVLRIGESTWELYAGTFLGCVLYDVGAALLRRLRRRPPVEKHSEKEGR